MEFTLFHSLFLLCDANIEISVMVLTPLQVQGGVSRLHLTSSQVNPDIHRDMKVML